MRSGLVGLGFVALLGSLVAASEGNGAETLPRIGDKVPELEFKDIRFVRRTLADFRSAKLFVVVATNRTCPIARRSLPVLAEMEKGYRDRGVRFLALDVGPDDSIIEMAADSVEAGAAFPFVMDMEGGCARALGLTRTPEVVVLDAERVLRYRGRIDDQFRIGGGRATATEQPLRDALDDLLAARPVRRAETPVDGCLITHGAIPGKSRQVTYSEHVAPIVQKHCQDCHRPGTQAPFALLSYRDAANNSAMIAEVVTDRRMPPWYADARHGEFTNRRGLDDNERATLLDWVRNGTPEGDPSKLPLPREFPTGRWRIGEPDHVVAMPIEHTLPATGFVDYRHAVLAHVFTEDTWAEAVEILPDNPRVVHHANLAFMKLNEQPRQENFITGLVPGGDPMVLDPGTAVLIPKGSVLGLQIHYTTTGKPERCKISVGLRFPRVPVEKRLYHQQVHTTRFKIPPFAPAHAVTASRTVDFDATGVGMFSHMHVRGKDMTFLAKRPDGAGETLLMIPNYNFDWQQSYRWAPGTKRFPKGTTLQVVAHFDNSEFNPYNPDPKAAVGNGEQTFHEMMYGFVFYTRDDEDLGLRIDPRTGFVAPSRKAP